MVKAELSYNPYLLETKVSFNGNPPRINSLVEKYSDKKLETWIDELPQVFYDEMNGFDFELAFFGTELDFEELEKAFARAGVSTDLVRLFHKERLGSRNEKVQGISQLIEWLDENPNERFDWTSFRERNTELFENVYPLVVIGDLSVEDQLFEDIDTSIDMVKSAADLHKTDLNSTPILFVLDKQSASSMPYNLQVLLDRDDVKQNQMFFLIKHDRERVERKIRDLGVVDPQIVSSPNDEQISRYLEIFPISEHIQDSLKTLRDKTEELGRALEEESRQSKIANKDIHERIRNLDDVLSRLKSSYDFFANKPNLDYPTELSVAKSRLLHEISNWRTKRTIISKYDEAKQLSQEYEAAIIQQFKQFRQEVNQIFLYQSSGIRSHTHGWFKRAHCDEGYVANVPATPFALGTSFPAIASDLMQIKSEYLAAPKEDFFGSLGKRMSSKPDFSNSPYSMKASNAASMGSDTETVFYCEKWRNYAVSVIDPIAKELIKEVLTSLSKLYDQLSEAYMNRIDTLISEVSAEKENVSTLLSKDEQLLQADRDWYVMLSDKLHAIERF